MPRAKPLSEHTPRGLAMKDTTPKTGRKVRGNNTGRGVSEARSRGTDTSNLTAAEMAEVIDPDKPLTEKMNLFVQNWAKGDSIKAASLRAGYADESVGYRLVKMPNVLALKAKLSAEYAEAGQMTREIVMEGLKEAIDMARLTSEPTAMIAGWREIGKICGYYAPVEHRVKVDVSGNIVLDRMNSMSDAELLKIISQGAPNGASTPLLSS